MTEGHNSAGFVWKGEKKDTADLTDHIQYRKNDKYFSINQKNRLTLNDFISKTVEGKIVYNLLITVNRICRT